MTERRTGTARASVVYTVAALLIIISILLTSCGNGGTEDRTAVQEPGTFKNGVCLSGDGNFTVTADEERWQPSQGEDVWELCFTEDRTVRISFSPAAGITEEMITGFEDSFAKSYVEALRAGYPDIRITDIREISGELAGLGMTMTDSSGNYRMCQLLYLASDGGDNGYLITATFPADDEMDLKQETMQIIESFGFT